VRGRRISMAGSDLRKSRRAKLSTGLFIALHLTKFRQ
jgi:hypothetical protein